MLCHICNSSARQITGKDLYPNLPKLQSKLFYLCDNQHDAVYVGCNKYGEPLGTLADAFTRYWRKKAHAAFDPIWKSKTLTRTQAYSMLSDRLGIEVDECHIGQFDAKTCKRAVIISDAYRNSKV